MQTVKTILLFLICVTMLGACGLKGPLYLPEENAAAKAAPADKDTAQDKDKEKKKNDTGGQPALNP
jgi:predicted small lipoprotein YifL